MPALVEIQAGIRDYMIAGDASGLADRLFGGRDPLARVAIHRRHYRASLAQTLLGKFPACAWLLGSETLNAAVMAFVEVEPPLAPCLAEYGDGFPGFLGARLGQRVPFIEPFAQLELAIGRASVAVTRPPLPIDALAAYAPESLPDLEFALQPGLAFVAADYPVHDLMDVFLGRTEGHDGPLPRRAAFIEIRGARGSFSFRAVDPGTMAFRSALQRGSALGSAAEEALACPGFDPGSALAALFAEELVIAIGQSPETGT